MESKAFWSASAATSHLQELESVHSTTEEGKQIQSFTGQLVFYTTFHVETVFRQGGEKSWNSFVRPVRTIEFEQCRRVGVAATRLHFHPERKWHHLSVTKSATCLSQQRDTRMNE